MAKKTSSESDDLVGEARKAFARIEDAESDNRQTAKDDLEFALEEKQWPDKIRKLRETEGRPVLTINKLKAFGKQVINDARQNKPSIRVHPVDSSADIDTAKVINGLIRNIEYVSSADVAYDTAMECAVWGGFGYIRIGLDYAYDDSFEMDLSIRRVANPFSVYGDPNSTAADSSDWDEAFIVDRLSERQFRSAYGDVAKVDWDDTDAWGDATWRSEDDAMVAEWWTREKVDKQIVQFVDLRDGSFQTYGKDEFAESTDLQALLQAGLLEFKAERTTKTCKVTQRIMTGAEVLRENEWRGKYIPIIPVYGDEFNIEGKRYFRSLIHSSVDAQRMYNFWRTNGAELVALAPRVPFIGPKGSFASDAGKWQTANNRSHAYLEYDPIPGQPPPQRQPLDVGAAAGSMQEALTASDDIKSSIGMYDASLGAKSNETSGRAIMARQREGDVATFHFVDNMSRAIRHTGRVLLDLIPKVYTKDRIIRVLGEDGQEKQTVQLGAPTPVLDNKGQPQMGQDGQPITKIHDLSVGKYDLTVSTGPSFTTRRQEAAYEMTEMVRAFPESAPVIGPRLAKNLDWPEADEIAQDLEKLSPLNGPQIPPEVQQQIEEGVQRIQQLEQENAKLKQAEAAKMAQIDADAEAKRREAEIDAQTEIIVANIKAAAQKEIERFKAQMHAEATVAAAAMRPVPEPRQQ